MQHRLPKNFELEHRQEFGNQRAKKKILFVSFEENIFTIREPMV